MKASAIKATLGGVVAVSLAGLALAAGLSIPSAQAEEGDKLVDMTASADQAAIANIATATDTDLLTLAEQIAMKEADPDPANVAAGVTIEADKAANATEHSLVAIHEANGNPLPEGFVVNKENCLACHGTYDDLKAATEDYHVIYNPHDSHYGELDCYRCHSVYDEPSNWCSTCHVGLPTDEANGWSAYPQKGY